ncbi:nitrile hydratase accessory protein [Mycobacterium simiae]|uniref:nitrile hydratase accessory protein n=1 Tax=Mycobacterium simiae TaxID=1784 RepID=UPI0003F737F8|nr:nitrile hydratase accessory protein [Mycobacterium simiae]PLV50940.1 nitrile hydratase [Mycobacterium tuberculosis variant microti OV254]BBX43194.1 nitrile hydratase accessory protein [Mycobacterium simiae]
MKLHDTCTTDQAAPQFDHPWQRRAFGLALALAEFGHYPWSDFQQRLIASIADWESTADDRRGDWHYYDHWVAALEKIVADRELLTATLVLDDGDHAASTAHRNGNDNDAAAR